jgi:uncharacterized membrane protein YhaH (DUF805 family)
VLPVVSVVLVLATALAIVGTPGYVLAKRRGLRNPIVAFVPFVGLWIVLFESIGRSGWLALLAFIPYVGWFVLPLWTGVEMPGRHGRSRWWTAILIVPILNLVGYWAYAFTLPKRAGDAEPDLQGLAA